jgi:tRNA(His) 5'-end guanylyltransferase
MTQYLDKWQAAKRFRISTDTMKRYRRSGIWIENIHWVKYNSRCIRYNSDLIEDWIHNRADPHAHQRAIEVYRANLLSNQRKTRRLKYS